MLEPTRFPGIVLLILACTALQVGSAVNRDLLATRANGILLSGSPRRGSLSCPALAPICPSWFLQFLEVCLFHWRRMFPLASVLIILTRRTLIDEMILMVPANSFLRRPLGTRSGRSLRRSRSRVFFVAIALLFTLWLCGT